MSRKRKATMINTDLSQRAQEFAMEKSDWLRHPYHHWLHEPSSASALMISEVTSTATSNESNKKVRKLLTLVQSLGGLEGRKLRNNIVNIAATVRDPFVVYHGTRRAKRNDKNILDKNGKLLNNVKPEQIVSFKYHVATSTNPFVAIGYTYGAENPVIFRIRLSKGHKVIPVASWTNMGEYEHEFLFAASSTDVKIKKISDFGNIKVIDASIV